MLKLSSVFAKLARDAYLLAAAACLAQPQPVSVRAVSDRTSGKRNA
jgi:hypothetical protein